MHANIKFPRILCIFHHKDMFFSSFNTNAKNEFKGKQTPEEAKKNGENSPK